MTSPGQLSDRALAVFAFALYHQLESGDVVSAVAAVDGAGHRADPEAITELEQRQLARQEGDKIAFTPEGTLMLSQLLDRLRGH
ncbi:hypothetical protein [uncultured Devosia sp.]|uniref:hypothetical protein n=1 Tax=uncultured Devosia sp. TaxID=211434 RepID=UPI0035CA7D26